MSNHRLIATAAIIVGVVLVVIGIVYLAEPARSLPAFFPGEQAGSSHHHTKHGLAALLLAAGAFVLAWFQLGPRRAEAS